MTESYTDRLMRLTRAGDIICIRGERHNGCWIEFDVLRTVDIGGVRHAVARSRVTGAERCIPGDLLVVP